MEEPEIRPDHITDPPLPVRPGLLTVLCILTFIGSGMNLVSSFFIGVFFNQFVPIVTEIGEKFKLPGIEMITEGKPLFFHVTALLYASSIAGALMMWNLKKNGFHVYTISQILLMLSPMYFYHLPLPSFADIIISGTFILLYARNLKFMRS